MLSADRNGVWFKEGNSIAHFVPLLPGTLHLMAESIYRDASGALWIRDFGNTALRLAPERR